ncbi:MAG: hypothetical protein R3B95_11465 [Nitrospirales bacterium]|nr:hypothetical protein [Nitrospirales bacterium]
MELMWSGLLGFASLVFLVFSVLGVYTFIATEIGPHATLKGKVQWCYGAFVVASSVGTMAISIMIGLARLVLS